MLDLLMSNETLPVTPARTSRRTRKLIDLPDMVDTVVVAIKIATVSQTPELLLKRRVWLTYDYWLLQVMAKLLLVLQVPSQPEHALDLVLHDSGSSTTAPHHLFIHLWLLSSHTAADESSDVPELKLSLQ